MALTEKLKAIADAIRGKTGKTDGLTLDQMPTEIEKIESGGGGILELIDTPVDNIYTLSSDIVDAGVNATLETYTLDKVDPSQFNQADYAGFAIATIEYLGDIDNPGTYQFLRSITTNHFLAVHGFGITSPTRSICASLLDRPGNTNAAQVNYEGIGLAFSNERSTQEWKLSYGHHNSYYAKPGDYRIKISRYKLPVSYFGGG